MPTNHVLAFADRMQAAASAAPTAPVERDLHLVVFELGAEEYAVPIAMVREVVRVADITRVPNAPPHIRGVMNLRGRILPVVEIRTRLGLEANELTPNSRVVVADVRNRTLGCLVDRVVQVMRLAESQVVPPPDEVRSSAGDAITGVGRRGDRLLMLLELERTLHGEA
ncbi:MAG TPA: chemotaxis protein CheW [Gemmatimonadales bacterium]